MISNTKMMLENAYENKYAIAQFNINNLEWTKYILEECEQLKTPVILGVSEGAIKYMGGAKVVSNIVTSLIEELNITINVALHLDHGSSLSVCQDCINAGFTSVMIFSTAAASVISNATYGIVVTAVPSAASQIQTQYRP